MREEARREGVWQFLTYTFVLVMTFLTIVPLYWIVVASTLPEQAFLSAGSAPRLIPGGYFAENFAALQQRLSVGFLFFDELLNTDFGFVGGVFNSVFIAVAYTLLSLVVCSMAGFAFAKYEFRYKEPIFYSILATLILPIQLLVIPLFLLMSQLGLTNSYWAIILP